MDPNDLLLTALRATLVYFFMLLVVRLVNGSRDWYERPAAARPPATIGRNP